MHLAAHTTGLAHRLCSSDSYRRCDGLWCLGFSPTVAVVGAHDPIVGIDLGMTSVVMAWVQESGGIPSVIPLEGATSMPAVVSFPKTGAPLIGKAAKDAAAYQPASTLTGLKRLLGRPFQSQAVTNLASRVSFKVVEGKDRSAEIEVAGQRFRVASVTGALLEHAKKQAEATLRTTINRCVVAVPAYFSREQKAAVREAVELAGMELVKLVHEPTAVALAYGFNQGPDARVVIVDMGGVRLDISVLEIAGNVFDVVATGGDPYLGGASLDARIARWILDEVSDRHGVRLTDHPTLMQKVRIAAEQAKRALGRAAAVDVNLPLEMGSEAKTAHVRLRAETLDAIAHPLTERVLTKIHRALGQRSLKTTDVDEVLLVGGGTRINPMKRHLQEVFGPVVRDSLPPEHVVALGAALLGESLLEPQTVAADFADAPVGIALADGRYLVVIDRASKLPLTRRVLIPTARDRQRTVEVDLFEGEAGDLLDASYLGSVVFPDVKEGFAGETKLVVDLSLESDRVLRVTSPEPGREGEAFSFPVLGHQARKNGRDAEPSFHVAQGVLDPQGQVQARRIPRP